MLDHASGKAGQEDARPCLDKSNDDAIVNQPLTACGKVPVY